MIGQGLLQTLRYGIGNSIDVGRMLSILGDPTLRLNVIAPPQNLTYDSMTLTLSWQEGEPNCQFYVYSASSLQGPFTRVSGPSPNTSANVSNPGVLMVRAAKDVTSGSATYNNFSQGSFYPAQ